MLSPPSIPRVCVGGISAAKTHGFGAAEAGALHWLCSAPRRGQGEGHDCVLSFYPWYQQNDFFIPQGILLDDTLLKFQIRCFSAHMWIFFKHLKTFISYFPFELGVSLKGGRKLSWIRCFVLTALLPSSLQSSCAEGCSIPLGCTSCIQPFFSKAQVHITFL